MARARIPTNLLLIRGAGKKNPSRLAARAGEPAGIGELGAPPSHLSQEVAACWVEISALIPAGVACRSDRLALELAASSLAQFRAVGGLLPAPLLLRLETQLSRFGLSPSDRSKVSARPADDEKDPLAEFLR